MGNPLSQVVIIPLISGCGYWSSLAGRKSEGSDQ